MCMIVGYNARTKEVAVSDSFDPEYAERWFSEGEAEKLSAGEFLAILW